MAGETGEEHDFDLHIHDSIIHNLSPTVILSPPLRAKNLPRSVRLKRPIQALSRGFPSKVKSVDNSLYVANSSSSSICAS